MPESQSHAWVETFRHRIGWGLQAFALPEDPTPAASILAAGRAADALGLDAFFIGDHPAYAPDAWLHLGVLAVQTTAVRLGSVVLCAGYRPPVLNARLAADLDHLSQGRVILGLGHGWNAKEFAQLGLPYPPVAARQEALEETVKIIRGVWGPQPFTFHGKHHFTVEEQVIPPPVQQPGPPLILAGSGEKTALRLVAKYADACNFGSGHATGLVRTSGEVRRKNDVLDQYCLDAGRDPGSVLRSHFTSWLMLAPTEREALAKRDRYYPNGLSDEQQHSRVIGTPGQAAAYYQALVNAGMQYFVVQILDATDLETVELLATDLAPRVSAATG